MDRRRLMETMIGKTPYSLPKNLLTNSGGELMKKESAPTMSA